VKRLQTFNRPHRRPLSGATVEAIPDNGIPCQRPLARGRGELQRQFQTALNRLVGPCRIGLRICLRCDCERERQVACPECAIPLLVFYAVDFGYIVTL
jgi:hypothetical protein